MRKDRSDQAARPPAGRLLIHPASLLSLVLLLLNDDVLKTHDPGFITGKLSDVAGLFLLPIVVLSVFEISLSLTGRKSIVGPRTIAAVCLTIAVGFTLVKVLPSVTDAYSAWLGVLRWPFIGAYRRVAVVTDPTDLITLPFTGLAAVLAVRGSRRSG